MLDDLSHKPSEEETQARGALVTSCHKPSQGTQPALPEAAVTDEARAGRAVGGRWGRQGQAGQGHLVSLNWAEKDQWRRQEGCVGREALCREKTLQAPCAQLLQDHLMPNAGKLYILCQKYSFLFKSAQLVAGRAQPRPQGPAAPGAGQTGC